MNKTIEQYAEELFGAELLGDLVKWYHGVIHCGCDFVVFIVRRCYVLFLILQEITGEMLDQVKGTVFLTDSSILLYTQALTNYYRRVHSFPSLKLVDDIFVHGRNVNKLLHTLEEHILQNMELENESDKVEVLDALVRTVRLDFFMSYKRDRLLDFRYWKKMHACVQDCSQTEWRQFSDQVAQLISQADVTNASFVFTAAVDRPELSELELLTRTDFQGCTEYTDVLWVGDQDGIRACATVRLIEKPLLKHMRAAPFVFLPSLTEEETDALAFGILKQFGDQTAEDWMRVLRAVRGRRAYHEMIVLILSSMYLFQVQKKYNLILSDMDWQKEISKLSRNYDTLEYYGRIPEMLENIIGLSRDNCDSLQSIINQALRTDKGLVSGGEYDSQFLNDLSVFWEETIEKDSVLSCVKSASEMYFYEKGWQEERSVIELKEPFIREKDERELRGEAVFAALKHLSGFVGTKYHFHGSETLDYLICEFLQMMDAGVIGIAIADATDFPVEGVCQYAKAGEPSQQLLPIRMYVYNPFLGTVSGWAESKARSFEEELERYALESDTGISNQEKEMIYRYRSILERVGQTPDDWSEISLERVDIQGSEKMSKEEVDMMRIAKGAARARLRINYLMNIL